MDLAAGQSQFNSDPACSSGSKSDIKSDSVGRKASASNPYCSSSDQTYGVTQYSYDALDRITLVTNPDNSTNRYTYAGPATELQDQGNGTQLVSHISQVDGLGRTVSVCEVSGQTQLGSGGAPAACGQAMSGTGFLTTYSFDALSNVTTVSQGGYLPRSFSYDSLSRLTQSSNPESGIIGYTYDADGNVLTRVAPAPNGIGTTVTTTSTYDYINRLTQKSYSDGNTPTATFVYDASSAGGVTLTNSIGRLSLAYISGVAGTYKAASVFSYDAMGRMVDNAQCTPQNCGSTTSFTMPIAYTYDLAGSLLTSTNGEGIKFSNTYDGAGRITGVTSTFNDSQHPPVLLENVLYNAPG